MPEQYEAGNAVVSYCTKCRLVLDHVVVAVVDTEIAKVQCKTCGSKHKFRDPSEVKKPRTVKKQEDAAKAAETLWESCLAAAKGRERSYDMSGRYRVGEVVVHDTFGKGIVRKIYMNKCDVLFKDKERLMASAN